MTPEWESIRPRPLRVEAQTILPGRLGQEPAAGGNTREKLEQSLSIWGLTFDYFDNPVGGVNSFV